MSEAWVDEFVKRAVTRSTNMAIDICAELIEEWPRPIQDRDLLVSALRRLKRANESEAS